MNSHQRPFLSLWPRLPLEGLPKKVNDVDTRGHIIRVVCAAPEAISVVNSGRCCQEGHVLVYDPTSSRLCVVLLCPMLPLNAVQMSLNYDSA